MARRPSLPTTWVGSLPNASLIGAIEHLTREQLALAPGWIAELADLGKRVARRGCARVLGCATCSADPGQGHDPVPHA